MVQVLPKVKPGTGNKLENITLRGFGGGWNAVASDISMDQKFLVTARNFRRTASGSMKLRWGSKFFSDISALVADDILDMEYFSAVLVVVTKDGRVTAVDGVGNSVSIWNPAAAAALGAAPWSTGLTTVDFVPFKSQLILHNGVDKPITISKLLVVTYLQDLATGSNVNVPIGRYGCVVSNYHCVAGIPSDPTMVYISSNGTAGTFVLDPAPNDGIKIDVGAFAPQGAVEIRGIAGFRQNLIVFFQDQAVIMRLGVYDTTTTPSTPIHKPTFPDVLSNFGSLSHRTIVAVENDLFFAGLQGLSDAKRSIVNVAGSLDSVSLSEYVDPVYKGAAGGLTDPQQLTATFMIWDALSRDLHIFIPPFVFIYSFDTRLRYRAWTEFVDMNFTCGCRSFLGRVFFGTGRKIFQGGNGTFPDEDYVADRQFDHGTKTWLSGTTAFFANDLVLDSSVNKVFRALFSFVAGPYASFAQERSILPNRWEEYEGIPINFEMELPWLDSKDPMRVKQLRFVSIATKGTAPFTLEAYVDNLYKDNDGNVIWDPALSMEFIGQDAPGEGYDAGPYGGSRRSTDPRLFSFPLKFKRAKFRITGTKVGNLEIANMSFLFNRGKYHR